MRTTTLLLLTLTLLGCQYTPEKAAQTNSYRLCMSGSPVARAELRRREVPEQSCMLARAFRDHQLRSIGSALLIQGLQPRRYNGGYGGLYNAHQWHMDLQRGR